jgi:hypothetical protein
MIEVVGVALLFALIVVGAVSYLFVYYFRYRWQVQAFEEERRRLLDQVYQLEQENELLRKTLELQSGGKPSERRPGNAR